MSISMYDASAPAFLRGLKALDAILDKAGDHARGLDIDEAVLLRARLYPDMFDLTRQVQITCDFAQRTVARLAGLGVPSSEDNETTLAELRARIETTVDFVERVPRAGFDGSEDREVSLKAGHRDLNFKGLAYLMHFALPNFYFHLTTAYDILRHNGVALGKRDYLGEL